MNKIPNCWYIEKETDNDNTEKTTENIIEVYLDQIRKDIANNSTREIENLTDCLSEEEIETYMDGYVKTWKNAEELKAIFMHQLIVDIYTKEETDCFYGLLEYFETHELIDMIETTTEQKEKYNYIKW